jgi:release factor glutamine methyltransferase
LAVLRTLVLDGATRLSLGPHPDRDRQDAQALLLHTLGRDKAWLMAHAEDDISADEAGRYRELIERRYLGEPMQYILGEAEFYGLRFRVTPDVLIPRPETEHLVERVLELAEQFQTPRIVDVGTGSGCIAVALAAHLKGGDLTAIDISASALDLARQNAELNGALQRIRFLEDDLLAPVAGQRFEIVVSNPPYVSEVDRASLSVEVRDHEPALALFAGKDGLDIYRRLIPAAFAALAPGGFVALEIGYGQMEGVSKLLSVTGFREIEFIPDLQDIPRVAVARRPS